MEDYFYFHWGWTVALDNGQHHPPILMSKSDISTQLRFKMQLYSDKTHQTDCLTYNYNDQQGIGFIEAIWVKNMSMLMKQCFINLLKN